MPVSNVRLSACAFMCATINSMPSSASVTTTVTRPAASKRGENTAPSSSAFLSDEGFGNVGADIAGPCSSDAGEGASGAQAAHHGNETDLFLGRVLEHA